MRERDTIRSERIYRQYLGFFDKAEQERRWNPYRDVPWDRVERGGSEELATVAETFCAVESYLPDYVSKGLNLVRQSFGQAWFSANWAYEESKHTVVLIEYLMRSGRRTPEQVFDLQERLRRVEWMLPFDTARRMTIYGCLQEMATFVIYMRQAERAKREGDEVLHGIFRLIGRDEMAHTHFYGDVVKVLLEEDRAETLDDIAHVFSHFQMPGVGIVPEYDARIEIMRKAGIDRALFLQKICFPVLKYLGVTRSELRFTRAAQGSE
ncbi:acyl-ACP desaturase [Pendulispora brunnea]|uniref:Acyl-ACP desaturase n=1 Tax=Pendulispora brunnea TaxID=2905690 RepID=A0ABZ2K611_9BACT